QGQSKVKVEVEVEKQLKETLPYSLSLNLFLNLYLCFAFCIFAHSSLRVTVRLKTSFSGVESSESTQKYPILSNWCLLPGAAFFSPGSTRHEESTSSDFGFK